MEDSVTCGMFINGGDIDTLGARLSLWLEKFKIYVQASAMTDPAKTKGLPVPALR
jgi:hypothetical protein